jgi:hypothetical protein
MLGKPPDTSEIGVGMKEGAGGVLQPPPITGHRYAYKPYSNYNPNVRV